MDGHAAIMHVQAERACGIDGIGRIDGFDCQAGTLYQARTYQRPVYQHVRSHAALGCGRWCTITVHSNLVCAKPFFSSPS